MIDITVNQNLTEILKTVDMNKTLLIMGNAETDHAINKIMYYDSEVIVEKAYGQCDLTEAYKLAKVIGAPHVFLANVKFPHDYIDIAEILKQYDFSYIVSTDLYFSDYFFDTLQNNRRVYYYKYLIEKLSPFNQSTIIATDKHAILYEDLDVFLDEMLGHIRSFKEHITPRMNGRNLVFVANNLEEHKFANVVLASILCASKPEEYPTYSLGPAVFDIDAFDVKGLELAYFKNNHLTGTTVENLLNFNAFIQPEKIVTIDRIAKYISRNFDLSHYSGRQLTVHQKNLIERETKEYFDTLLNWIIRNYNVRSIDFIKEAPGVSSVVVKVDVWTVNSTEKITVVVEG